MAGPADETVEWLLDQAMLATRLDSLLPGLAGRLQAAGLDIARIFFGGTILDPEYDTISCIWTPDAALETDSHAYDADDAEWRDSPLRQAVMERREVTRYRLSEGEGCNRFPLLAGLRARGMTDYVALVALFGLDGTVIEDRDSGVVASFATARPSGFTDGELDLLRRCRKPLGLAARNAISMRVINTVLKTYLGEDVGQRILRGEIRRGMVKAVDAAILWADLRGFTLLADTVPQRRLVAMLDDYLDCMAAPVEHHGGQVLKFMGDGMLATFALDGAPAAACAAAVAAASESADRIAALNVARSAKGEPVMALDVALHLGEVLYGNVGSRNRMDFTVIGPAVNEASRMEALCGALACPLVASGAFVAASGMADRFRSIGAHRLRGVRGERELFTLADRPRAGI